MVEAMVALGNEITKGSTEETMRINVHMRASQTELSEKEMSDLTLGIMAIRAWNRMRAAARNIPGSADKAFGLDKAGFQMSACRGLKVFFLLFCLAGCATQGLQVATMRATASSAQQSAQAIRPQENSATSNLVYITDRAPVIASGNSLSYGSERAIFLSFGTVSIASGSNSSTGRSQWRVSTALETGRFPATPYGVVATANGLRRTPHAVAAHEKAGALLQAEVAGRLAAAKRKEVVVFIHGYNNSFDDAVLATAEICRSLQNEFVCVVMTWPAAGSGGSFFGYNIDRESGEFAVADFKKAVRIIARTTGVERLHLLAHSRGTDVLASVIQQLAIEAYVSRSSLWQRYKIANAVFFAPDIDLDVASSKLFAWISDPDLAFGSQSAPNKLLSQGATHLTVYSSPRDEALKASTLISGSALRLGQLDIGRIPKDKIESASKWAGSHMGEMVDFIEFSDKGDFLGHSYFLSEAIIKADLVALIRDRAKAGDPRRQLVEIRRPFWRIADARQTIR